MRTHAARVDHSARLARLLAALDDGIEHTTLDLMQSSHICAVNSCIAELRANGYTISCSRRGDRWFYQLLGSPSAGAKRA